MNEMLSILGSVFCLISLFAIIYPGQLLRVAKNITITTPLRIIAFIVRILLGITIIFVADSTQFPRTLQIFGILLIFSGVRPHGIARFKAGFTMTTAAIAQ